MKKLFLLGSLLACLTFSVHSAEYYVKVNANGNGTSWNDATTLEKALAKADQDGDVVYIAAGTYIPSVVIKTAAATTDRDKCFEISQNITLIGGFSENPQSGEMPDAEKNKTILDGKYGSGANDNCYHVVWVTAPQIYGKVSRLIGLTIQNGNASGTTGDVVTPSAGSGGMARGYAGGIAIHKSDVVIDKCEILNNKATARAGLNITNGRLTMTNSLVEGNVASSSAGGGAMHLDCRNGYLYGFTIENCTFRNNTSGGNGGVAYTNQSYGSFKNCVFDANTGAFAGGGFQLYDKSMVAFYNCVFKNNRALAGNGGAAIFVRENSVAQIVNCTFHNNNSSYTGNCLGGTISSYGTSATNNTVINIINSTFTGNVSAKQSGGVYNMTGGVLNVYNSIISGNAGETTSQLAGDVSGLNIKQSIIGDTYYNVDGKIVTGTSFDPKSMLGAFDGMICPLQGNSNPAIEKGITLDQMMPMASEGSFPAFLLEKDQQGNPRKKDKMAIGAWDNRGEALTIGNSFRHLIMYGQSLSTANQSYPALSSEVVSGNYVIGNQPWSNYRNLTLNEIGPLFGAPAIADIGIKHKKNRADQVRCETPIIAAANHLQKKMNNTEQFLVTSSGFGGTTIEQLSANSTQSTVFYRDYLQTINAGAAIAKEKNYSITCPALFWMQGEYNFDPGTTSRPGLTPGSVATIDKDEYKNLLIKLKEDMQNDVCTTYNQTDKPLFYTYQVGAQYVRGNNSPISMSQLEAANENKDIICVGPVYQMTDRGGHLDPNGYRWYGEMIGKVYYKTEVEKKKFTPLQPQKLTKVNDNTIRIDFTVPVKPLTFDTHLTQEMVDYGFQIYDEGVKKTISTILIKDGESVEITCTTAFSGKLEISYATDNTRVKGTNALLRGNGNLRDSDPTESYYTYVDLDGKKSGGTFVFPREKEESTLRPAFEPVTSSGDSFYGQKYPLYNFCVHFYYVIPAGENSYTVINNDVSTENMNIYTDVPSIRNLGGDKIGFTLEQWDEATFIEITSGRLQLRSGYQSAIDINNLPKGAYIVQLKSKNKFWNLSFIR